MSDRSQGEGWWLASDGKWYPPESLPGEPAASSGEPEGADLGTRFVARLIDGAILAAAFFAVIVPIVVVGIFGGSFGSGGAFGGRFSGSGVAASIVWAAVGLGYFAVMESSRGQTFGKMVMKLKTQGPDGENPSLEMAVRRNSWIALSVVPVIGGLAQFAAVIYIAVTVGRSAANVGWHDTFAGGTRVVVETL